MKRAIIDLLYLIGLWFILRVNPQVAGELLEKWSMGLQRFNK